MWYRLLREASSTSMHVRVIDMGKETITTKGSKFLLDAKS
jgi:uncharacterized protein (UPF0262 family)